MALVDTSATNTVYGNSFLSATPSQHSVIGYARCGSLKMLMRAVADDALPVT